MHGSEGGEDSSLPLYLETGDGRLVRKHTIVVQPASKISMQVTVDAKGEWAYHCHLLYHMGGMFRKVVVS